MPDVRRTRATLRSAELGFFGVVVYTRVHTPRRCGAPFSAGVLGFGDLDSRPFRTSCWIVGKPNLSEELLGATRGRAGAQSRRIRIGRNAPLGKRASPGSTV